MFRFPKVLFFLLASCAVCACAEGADPKLTFRRCATDIHFPSLPALGDGEALADSTAVLRGVIDSAGRVSGVNVKGGSAPLAREIRKVISEAKFADECHGWPLEIVFVVKIVTEIKFSVDWVYWKVRSPNIFVIEMVDGRRGRL